jgi:hypothetical protein
MNNPPPTNWQLKQQFDQLLELTNKIEDRLRLVELNLSLLIANQGKKPVKPTKEK